ncbi:hypothetical protein [Acinetobacter schindleri]|uniref:hypothetical protein n=1 Tax=Acinetobacter schindleri TaxID=108981 RepID=UPI0016141C5D|nr:hypothetical protein [Acinetobacter schindleri]MBB4835009.1 hypothetical protein [Acinetobacter schindleri]
MFSNLTFPKSPPIAAEWQPIFLEPIINSGERIAILIVIRTTDGAFSVHRALDDKLLKILFGDNHSQINGLIEYIEKTIKTSIDWVIPFDGVYAPGWTKTNDFSMEGILSQALSQTSSLSTFGNLIENTKRNLAKGDSWSSEVKNIVVSSMPNLMKHFDRDVLITNDISYTYNFFYESFVANLLDFKSLNKPKAQTSIFKMQLLAHNTAIKKKQLILQLPSKLDLSEMSAQKQLKIEEQIHLFSHFLNSNKVDLISVETSLEASEKILSAVA